MDYDLWPIDIEWMVTGQWRRGIYEKAKKHNLNTSPDSWCIISFEFKQLPRRSQVEGEQVSRQIFGPKPNCYQNNISIKNATMSRLIVTRRSAERSSPVYQPIEPTHIAQSLQETQHEPRFTIYKNFRAPTRRQFSGIIGHAGHERSPRGWDSKKNANWSPWCRQRVLHAPLRDSDYN